jgi:hypothetical protein
MFENAEDFPEEVSRAEKTNVFSVWYSIGFLALCFLIMESGWGIRNSFGHSRGSMIPGALFGLSIAVCSRREDWWRRVAVLGLISALGFGIAGQTNFSGIVSYASGGTFFNSFYGYASIFVIGALYGGMGGGFLGLALTKPSSFLKQITGPLIIIYLCWLALLYSGLFSESLDVYQDGEILHADVNQFWLHQTGSTFWLYDTIWICVATSVVISSILYIIIPRWRDATSLIFILSAGWFAGMFVILKVFGFRMNPHRAEAWAGVVGIQLALIFYLLKQKNRAAMMLIFYGLLSGGIGFTVGVYFLMLARTNSELFKALPFLQEFSFYSLTKQFLGAFIGLGLGYGLLRLINRNLSPIQNDRSETQLEDFSLFFLLGPLICFNFKPILNNRIRAGRLQHTLFGYSIHNWAFLIGIVFLILVIYFIFLIRKKKLNILPSNRLGKAQLLALLIGTIFLTLHMLHSTFHTPNLTLCLAGIVLTHIFIIRTPNQPILLPKNSIPAESSTWNPGWKHWVLWLAVPVLLWSLAKSTVEMDIKPATYRYPPAEIGLKSP